MPQLSETEQRVLDYIEADKEAWFNHYESGIVEICGGDFDVAMATCRRLRTLKLVDGTGRGKFAQYGARL